MMRSAKTGHSSPRARRPWLSRRAALVLAAASLALLALAPSASARPTRAYEGSFTTFAVDPSSLAVDQGNGDVYIFDRSQDKVHRFTAAGSPHNFTAGPDVGTNALSGFTSFDSSIAIDNSGGPLDGTVYVSDGSSIKAFAPSGEQLGAITASNAASIAVDQTDGNLYVNTFEFGSYFVRRFAPNSPGGVIDNSDYAVSGIAIADNLIWVAADAGRVYVVQSSKGVRPPGNLVRYAASDFAPGLPQATGVQIDSDLTSVAIDPGNGDVYVNHGDHLAVFASSGASLYEFGDAAYFGTESTDLAVKSAASGPAAKAYVIDPTSEHTVDIFGALTQVPTYTHEEIAAFGPDGTSATQFGFHSPSKVAFDSDGRRLYALQVDNSFNGITPGIFGFDVSAPPAFPLLPGFEPLATADSGLNAGLAVDNTGLASAGNVYLASQATNLLYGWDDAGTQLAGFPVDPATTPGTPDGSPKDLCGAAVDSAGNVWVSNASAKKVLKYSSAGAYLGAVDTGAQGGGPCGLALDSAGNLFADVSGSGVWKYTAASGYATAVHLQGGSPGSAAQNHSLAVDSANDHLFVADFDNPKTWIDEYDPAGNLIDEFATEIPDATFEGLAVDPASGDLYVADAGSQQVRVLGPGQILPEAKTQPASALANATATLNGLVGAQGVALTDCHFEYVSRAAFGVSGFADLSSGGSVPCDLDAGSLPLDFEQHAVSAAVTGLGPNSEYRFRLIASSADGTTTTAPASFSTAGPAVVETTGSPIRTTTTAQITGRVYPVRAATTYHFEYGADGPCDTSPCASTPDLPAGSGDQFELVAEQIEGLEPGTTYHYRLVADNSNPAGPAAGQDVTVTTRASDAPLSHGHFPGPPGSDRAYEQVSLSDSGGNPVGFIQAVGSDGDRAVYGISGGTPISNSGSFFSLYYAQRPAGEHPQSGWQTTLITPARQDLVGADWYGLFGSGDLSSMVSRNLNGESGSEVLWRLNPGGSPERLLQPIPPQELKGTSFPRGNSSFGVSADGSRVIAPLRGGSIDPAYPAAAAATNLYDISSGAPKLVSLLPGNVVAGCGVNQNLEGEGGAFAEDGAQAAHWVSGDGSLVVFPSAANSAGCHDTNLYLRDIPAGETKPIGPLSLVKATPDAVFGTTTANLDPARDQSDGGNDLYRYDIGDESLECVSCLVPGIAANVTGNAPGEIAVSEDGSRAYFSTTTRLLPGAPPDGTPAIYRVNVAAGSLAYVAPGNSIGYNQPEVAISPDGSKLVFRSNSGALNPLGSASTNGGTHQYYLYDDADRSLSCVSCPSDGSAPLESVPTSLTGAFEPGQPNLTALAANGTLAFATSTPLVGADQNTPGTGGNLESAIDVYEWRDGRQILISDGLSRWSLRPFVEAISPSGHDIFFSATAQYTPDALDANRRLYDARIGGGIDFPDQPQPCPLEVCQGTPKGAPEEGPPASAGFTGPGTAKHPAPRKPGCPKGRRKAHQGGKVRCVKTKVHHKRTANHNRRAAR